METNKQYAHIQSKIDMGQKRKKKSQINLVMSKRSIKKKTKKKKKEKS